MYSIYVYSTKLPPKIKEMVTPCEDGYTVYIKSDLDSYQRMKAFRHAVTHIRNDDFNNDDIQDIENVAHKET